MLNINSKLARAVLLMSTLSLVPACGQAKLSDREDVRDFIGEMVNKHGFSAKPLTKLFDQAKIREDIIKAISRPAESKPWYKYRPIFVTKSRTDAGVTFFKRYEKELRRAEATFGVPAEIIVAIIGVETRYGQYRGSYPVLDSLTTLAFEYPKRASFFKKELEQYLLLTKEEKFDPAALKGSYAGAMGHPQFISSSYRHYAIDFSGDGKRDLLENPVDAIGSVANYFKRHGWQTNQPIVAKATATEKVIDKYGTDRAQKPARDVKSWQKLGLTSPYQGNLNAKATFLSLEGKNGPETWLGFDNFYVITRYNHSALYALAVYQLSQKIKHATIASQGKPAGSDTEA